MVGYGLSSLETEHPFITGQISDHLSVILLGEIFDVLKNTSVTPLIYKYQRSLKALQELVAER